jgi:molybdopterin molybdotransferase
MASVGCSTPKVFKQPIIGIISTGDEIVEPETTPNPSQIRNSNGHQLIAQVLQCNAIPKYFGIISDTYDNIFNAIKKGIKTCDILLLTGGVSMGDFDYVPKVMSDLGINILFNRVAVQPGKPTTYGKKDNVFVFGLPGNPVSSFVQFETLTKPLINKITGQKYNSKTVKLPLASDYKRKKSERKAYIPITITDESYVSMTEYHGSAHIYSLPNANALAIIEKGIKELKKGDLVDVRFL